MKPLTSARVRRSGTIATALAITALFAAACGGDNKTPTAQQTQSRYQQAVAYAKCMRAHGDPAWPDPNKNGSFANNNGSLDRSSDAYKKANEACQKLGFGVNNAPDPAQQQQGMTQLLKFSQCMRAHGISKYPDPTSEAGGGVGISIPRDIDQNSPQYKAAQQACRSLMPRPGR
jgi:hypothetical protein